MKISDHSITADGSVSTQVLSMVTMRPWPSWLCHSCQWLATAALACTACCNHWHYWHRSPGSGACPTCSFTTTALTALALISLTTPGMATAFTSPPPCHDIRNGPMSLPPATTASLGQPLTTQLLWHAMVAVPLIEVLLHVNASRKQGWRIAASACSAQHLQHGKLMSHAIVWP